MRARHRVSTGVAKALATAALLVPVACSVIIGADKDRRVTGVGPDRVDASTDGDGPPPMPTGSLPPCAPGEKRCEGMCVRADDPVYGCHPTECRPRCSVPFAVVVRCLAGGCAPAQCTPGRADCNSQGADGCESDIERPETCGSCVDACPSFAKICAGRRGGCVTSCPMGTTRCGDQCVDVRDDPSHCGSCGAACPADVNADPSCVLGTCGLSCREGFAQCDGSTAGCEPKRPYFVDQDRDGFGAGLRIGEQCELPGTGLSFSGADCNDGDARVKPGQRAYFGVPYTGANGAPSFDYDCNGLEEGDPALPRGPCSPSFMCH